VIGVDDTAALVALQACKYAGIRVPAAMQIIGIDDTPGAAGATPSLATFRQPLDEMTACAVDLALGRRSLSLKFKAVFVPGGSLGAG